MSQPEPEWDAQTRAQAAALIRHSNQVHHTCGQPLERSTATNRGWRVDKVQCQACRAMRLVKEKYHAEHKNPQTKRSDVDDYLWYVEELPLPQGPTE